MTPGRLVVALVAMNVVLLVVGALVIETTEVKPGAGLRVGLVFDVGGKNDRSFNESAWRGLKRAQAELGVTVQFVEPSQGTDRETALRRFAGNRVDLVIGVGFIFSKDLERLAREFPEVRFAGIDYAPTPGVAIPPNLAGLSFREQEGSFLVGAIAGLLTRTKTVGFVGGMTIPLIKKFEAGYIAGVHHVCPGCAVLSAYAGTDPKAFADPPLGAELASAQYDKGADIIFHAAGKTGDGVFAVAKQRDERAIGVDSDQYAAAPCCVLTSMVKRVDVAVIDIIKDISAGRFTGGIHELGLAEHGVGFVADEHNRDRLPLDIVQQVTKLGDDIIAHRIEVPDR